jgi:hypothetical protein
MRNLISIGLFALATLTNPAEAKFTKHWVLKQMLNGNVAQYIAFKSPQECEIARRRWLAGMAKIKARFKNSGALTINADGKCLDYIPIDYELAK